MRRVQSCLASLVLLFALVPVVAAAGPGDEASTAIPVSAGTSRFDSTAMTASSSDPSSCGEFSHGFSNTMWFSYQASGKSLALADVNSFVSDDGSTDFLAIVFVFAQQGGSLDLVGCSAYPATVTFSVDAGTTYLIMVGGLSSQDIMPGDPPELADRGGTFDLTLQTIRGRVQTNRFHDSDTFLDEGLSEDCGVTVMHSFEVRGADKTFLSSSGVRMFSSFVVGSDTFSANGHTLTFNYADTFFDRQNGNATFVGMPIKVRLDGGIVSIDAGKLVIGPDGSVVFEGGRHPVFFEGVDICALLGG